MKTPHRITLVRGETVGVYNPETSQIEYPETDKTTVPCLVNFISRATVLREYGDIQDNIIICRFNQAQSPFESAIYDSKTFKPMDKIDAPIKGAVRLKEVLQDAN